ncbi:hypothetical protein EBX93_15710 [bacterium]|nr:hypothetical protein [bacterium]
MNYAPIENFIAWFGVSFVFGLYSYSHFRNQNRTAVLYGIAQMIFFMVHSSYANPNPFPNRIFPSLTLGILPSTKLEKPNLEMAKTFLASGDFLWNAGIFTWSVNSILAALEKHVPEINELFQSERGAFNTSDEAAAVERIYTQCVNTSIDIAVMEKAENVFVIPANFGWSDLGTWNSAWDNMEKDYFGNAVVGKQVMVVDANNCMVHASSEKLMVLQGLKDYIIVDTPDVLLICKRDQEQAIKEYVAEVKRNFGEQYL